MIFCHKGLNSFEGSKKAKQMPSEGSRKREIVKMPSDMIKHALLKMLPELHKRLQRLQRLQHKCRQKLLHRHKLRLLCKHKCKPLWQQLRLDSWISFMRL